MTFALWLTACAEDPAQSWQGSWAVARYEATVVPPEPTGETVPPTTTTTPASPTHSTRAASTDTAGPTETEAESCEEPPSPADFFDDGFDMTVDPLGDSWYVEVHPCAEPEVCDAIPWAAGGSRDLDASGGVTRIAGTRFLASSVGGGVCTLDWWDLTIAGSPVAPELSLVTTQATVTLTEGDALDCEDQLEIVTDRPCTGVYLLSGEAW